MNAELDKRDKHEVHSTAAEQMQGSGLAYVPDVDIYASRDEILFVVDLPGVEKGDVSMEINENDTLILKAKCKHCEPSEAMLRQYDIGDYYRAFQLTDEYDKDKGKATLENGTLTLRIPKREEAKPKTIHISA
jgi:HSP20 family protein